MPLPRAVPVTLTAAERKTLKKRARGVKTAYRDRLRAQIVLAAGRGRENARIAADLQITVDTARKWRGRFAGRGLAGLADLPRSGRPRRISELTRAAVVALACQLPAATGVPLSRWTGPELLAELTQAGVADALSVSSVLRILAEHPVKPWQYQSWISPRDPDFEAKAAVILDLYQGFYQGQRLQPGDRILSVDAKPSIQARGRCRPTAPAARGTPMKVEHEYVRHGALALLAALDVHTGKVFAATPDTTGIAPFMDLMSQVMSRPEYKDAPRVFVIVDNGSDHRGQAAAEPAPRRLPERDHDPHARARVLVEPGGDRLFRYPEESPHPRRLPRPGHPQPCLAGLRAPLQPHRPAVQLEVHRQRPDRTAPPHQPARTRCHQPASHPAPGRLITPRRIYGPTH